MSSLADSLRQQYPCEHLNAFGECIIVPSRHFKPEWEQQLRGEGYKVFMQSHNGESSFFIRMKTPNATAPKKPWTETEVNRLKELVPTDLSIKSIADKLGRSRGSVQGKIQRLHLSRLSTAQPANTPNPSPTIGDDVVKEYLACVSELYPRYPHVCTVLLRECTAKILGGSS